MCSALFPSGEAKAQGRNESDWVTNNGDAQRSAWVRMDWKISKETMEKPGFKFLWKLKLKNEPRQLNSLTPPSTLERLIGYRGFRMLGFVGGSSNKIFAIDTDLGRLEWEKQFETTTTQPAGTLDCPGGMTTSVVRPTSAFLAPLAIGARGGSGRTTSARSAVGEPGQGAVTLALVRPNPPQPAPPPTPPPSPATTPARTDPASPPGGQFGAGPFLVYALSGDGMLHSMHLSNGADYLPPVKFLPPNANANGLIVTANIAYAVTEGSCNGTENGLWALDLSTKTVITWKGNIAGSAGPAFDGNGTLYVATEGGGTSPESRANSVVALDAKTLAVKEWYSPGKSEFSSSPVIFEYKGKTLIAVSSKDGQIHLLDSNRTGGSDHMTALVSSAASSKEANFSPAALASWQDSSGTRWILAPIVGTHAAGFSAINGVVRRGAVVAWKVVEQGGKLSLQPGWVSRDLESPLTPTIINGVVFVTSSGEHRTSDNKVTAAQRALRSARAVLYALDGTTGKELWSSGTTITSFARGTALSGGMGQVYLTTHDGTIYAFGFPMEH
jgi:outer membrane protein assembly factor BamB